MGATKCEKCVEDAFGPNAAEMHDEFNDLDTALGDVITQLVSAVYTTRTLTAKVRDVEEKVEDMYDAEMQRRRLESLAQRRRLTPGDSGSPRHQAAIARRRRLAASVDGAVAVGTTKCGGAVREQRTLVGKF